MSEPPVLLVRARARIGWYVHSCKTYLFFGFSLASHLRCVHRSRLFGWRCWRAWTSDYFCGLHNSLCQDDKAARCRAPLP